ncbi:MAG: deoxyribose-phosphate aldolase [Xanthomonadales bacterium]|nr:deoxyribose-phosphate aldolase [Xanthomonadales bacterium]
MSSEKATLTDSKLVEALLGHLDLTSLGDDDRPTQIEALCERATRAVRLPAAICVHPEHVTTARRALDRLGAACAVASVVNFPDGGDDPGRAARECRRVRAAGADEIDAVLPWRALIAGNVALYRSVAMACRDAAGDCRLKFILESGALPTPALIRQASELAIDAGADFIKTSTGKVETGATEAAARLMLDAIAVSGRHCGFKASGGIREVAQALVYRDLVAAILGADALTASRFRIGASGLFDELLAVGDMTGVGSPTSGGTEDRGPSTR